MLSDPDYSAMLFISLRLASFSYRVAYLLIIILMDVYNTLYIVRVRHVLLEWSESDYYCTYVQPQMHVIVGVSSIFIIHKLFGTHSEKNQKRFSNLI